ncbi:phage tail sheath family protein [Paraburkholderia aspalathi]|uniref:phage tail sheath family protein n=1 Tax=Paraburkholderia aspalathi TaxID=1324617 RepID=UPI0038B6F0FB
MSDVYEVPGVYVVESSALSMSVHQGETAVPVFIGHFFPKKAAVEGVFECVRVTDWLAFTNAFELGAAEVTVQSKPPFEAADGAPADAPGITVKHTPYTGAHSVRLYFENGGGPCYVLHVPDRSKAALACAAITQCPDITLLCWCERTSDEAATIYPELGKLLAPAPTLGGNRGYFLLTDGWYDEAKQAYVAPDFGEPTQAAAYFPALQTTYRYAVSDEAVKVSGLDQKDWKVESATLAEMKQTLAGVEDAGKKTTLSGLYDAIHTALDAKLGPVILRASCAMAGVIARTDRERGVWKAPANVALNGVAELVAYHKGKTESDDKLVAVRVDDDMNGQLVEAHINAIRQFRGQGVLAWGARTMVNQNQPAWRYIPVRRLFNAVGRDMGAALQVAVFEPNSAPTWERVRAALAIYLNGLWREGALMGDTPEQAYFVHIGLGLTMTEADISQGRMKVKVGMAAVRPAEFIILELTQQVTPG